MLPTRHRLIVAFLALFHPLPPLPPRVRQAALPAPLPVLNSARLPKSCPLSRHHRYHRRHCCLDQGRFHQEERRHRRRHRRHHHLYHRHHRFHHCRRFICWMSLPRCLYLRLCCRSQQRRQRRQRCQRRQRRQRRQSRQSRQSRQRQRRRQRRQRQQRHRRRHLSDFHVNNSMAVLVVDVRMEVMHGLMVVRVWIEDGVQMENLMLFHRRMGRL